MIGIESGLGNGMRFIYRVLYKNSVIARCGTSSQLPAHSDPGSLTRLAFRIELRMLACPESWSMHCGDFWTPGSTSLPARSNQLGSEAVASNLAATDVESTKPQVDIDANIAIIVDPETIDSDGFVSLWSVASATTNAELHRTRALASRFLGFLCKHSCTFVVASSSDAKYLDERFERDNSLLYNWSIDSENVDVVTQHAYVPAQGLVNFLKKKKFDASSNYSPRRADRVKWFTDDWCVG
jgi:hypothetical protein